MDTNPSETVFHEAMLMALVEQSSVVTEIGDLSTRLDDLRSREEHLRHTVESLRALLGLDATEAEADESEPVVVEPRPRADPRVSDPLPTGADGTEGDAPGLPQPPHLSRPVSHTSSPYRMGLILREAQRPMTREEILREYAGRGWIEGKWRDPEGAMVQALRRAVEYGWVRRLDRRTFVTTQTPGGQQAAGDERLIGELP